MNTLPNHTSFHGVLDSIIRSYLLNELPPEAGESGTRYHNIAERDLGISQTGFLKNLQGSSTSRNANFATGAQNIADGQAPGTSTSMGNMQSGNPGPEPDYVKALYQCFEKRGVFKELQTFLRQKLVSVLQDEWPDLHHTPGNKVGENTIVFRLVEDFLKCHRLLYTLSVLVSEGDVTQLNSKELYGKLSAKQAEDLLDELGIKRCSRLSGQVLKCYFDQESFSLLESMHYLGVWVDHSIGQLEENDNQNGKAAGKGGRQNSGKSIFLSRSQNKPIEKVMKDVSLQCGSSIGNSIGVERRLLEMEKRLEKDKEAKLKEAIDRYKDEEQIKLQDEMEAKFQLRLIEREKEHFADIQRRMEEVNSQFQRERQKWLEEKVKHEQELVEFQKRLADMAKKRLAFDRDSFLRESTTLQSNQALFTTNQNNTDQSNNVECLCGCNCTKKTSRSQTPNRRLAKVHSTSKKEKLDASLNYKPHPPHDSVQQDQIVFLQYQLEKQNEEITSLRRQLELSRIPPMSNVKSTPSIGSGDAQRQEGRPAHGIEQNRDIERTSDDLGQFLNEAKARMGKLDVAVSKVDEIMHDLLAKKRESTTESALLSARFQAISDQRRLKRSLFTTTNSLYTEIPATLGALVHQQLPEKQIKFVTPELQRCSLSNDVYDDYNKHTGLSEVGAASVYNNQGQGIITLPSTSNALQQPAEMQTPSTPRERIFPVAYGPKEEISKISQNQKSSNTNQTNDVDIKRNGTGTVDADNGESLFHMAAKHLLENERSVSSKENSFILEEKAIKHGALSKKKVESPDEYDDGDCRSVSIAESISIVLRQNKNVLTTLNGNASERAGNKRDKQNLAITKKKISVDDSQGSTKSESIKGRQSKAKVANLQNKTHQTLISPPSSEQSSHLKNDLSLVPASNHKDMQELEPDVDNTDNDHSNISVPKSEDIEDFWQI